MHAGSHTGMATRRVLHALLLAALLCLAGAANAYAAEGSDASAQADNSQEAASQEAAEASEENGDSESPSTAQGAETTAERENGNLVDPTQRADNSFIYDTTIESLFDQASLYDGRTAQVVGEVVGDQLAAGDGNYWIMLTSTDSDEPASISVLLSADQVGQIDRYGRYGVTGTTLQVRGTFYQACAEHDGQPDLHATDTSVIAKGTDHPDAFSLGDFVPGIIALIIGLALMGAFYFARERMR